MLVIEKGLTKQAFGVSLRPGMKSPSNKMIPSPFLQDRINYRDVDHFIDIHDQFIKQLKGTEEFNRLEETIYISESLPGQGGPKISSEPIKILIEDIINRDAKKLKKDKVSR